MSAAQLNASSSVPGTFAYTPAIGTVLPAGSAQLNVNFTPTDNANYTTVTGTHVSIVVNKATPAISWANPSAISYGTPLSATQLNASSLVAGSFAYTPSVGTVLSAGTGQTLSVNFTPTDNANYTPVTATALITVNKALPTITWPTPGSISYGTVLSTTQLNASASVPGTFTYNPPVNTMLNAGVNQTLSASFVPTDNNNFSTIASITRQITVTKASPVVSWSPPLPIKVGVPLGATQLNATADIPGTFVYTPPSGTVLAAGNNQNLSVSFTPTDAVNYNTIPNTTVQITVSAKDNPVITWATPAPITYGTALSATQLNATADVAGTFSYTPPIGTVLNAGASVTLTANFVPADGVNYNSLSRTVQITVNKAVLTATPANATRVYGAINPTFTINYSGFVNGNTIAVIDTPPAASCNAIASSGAGASFPIIAAGGADNNYSFNYVSGSLSITKANLTAKPDDKSRSYGLANPTFTITYSGFVNGDNVSSITPPVAGTVATQTSNVNSYPITLSGGTSANYNFVFQTGTLTINISPLTARVDDKSKTYGQANPAFTITYSGFLNADNVSSITEPVVSTSATATSAVGSYPLTLAGGSAVNYGLILQNGTLTIGKATLIAKADDKSKTYGQANPPNSVTYTGFVNSDNSSSITAPTLSGPAATPASSVGSYPISLTGGSAVNYNLTLQNGALTILPAPLRVTVQNKSRGYGLSNPPFTFTYTTGDFLNGDNAATITTPVANTVATPASGVGTYPITLTGSTLNYNFVVTNGTLTITKATLTVKANDNTKTYGNANPSFTIDYNGFVNGDSESSITSAPLANTTATAGSSVGNYPISVAGGASANYQFTYVQGTLSVTKANLTAKANDQSRLYGAPNPALTISYMGFVNGDAESVLDIKPTAATIATTTSLVGNYPITVNPGTDNNYNFNYVNGVLSVLNGAAPEIKDFIVTTNEDVPLVFAYSKFHENFLSSPGDSIVSIKFVTVPVNGVLSWKGNKVLADDVVTVEKGAINSLSYLPKANDSGQEVITWNASDGPFNTQNAKITIKVLPVNDAPVLNNIETEPLLYGLGDDAVFVTTSLILSDVDNNFTYSARISFSENYTKGDLLALKAGPGVSEEIKGAFDAEKGELTLSGKDSKANYETALHNVLFSSPISVVSTLSDKTVSIVVNDSIANSNIQSRKIQINKVFPELSIVNAFTPNGEGPAENEYWNFVNGDGNGLEYYEVINIAVFDQNGVRVFECHDVDCKWDGKMNGKELPAGPYFYSIDLDNGKRKYNGTVNILK